MDFALPYSEEQERFRQEVRSWLKANCWGYWESYGQEGDFHDNLGAGRSFILVSCVSNLIWGRNQDSFRILKFPQGRERSHAVASV